jgi:hypothetical protein
MGTFVLQTYPLELQKLFSESFGKWVRILYMNWVRGELILPMFVKKLAFCGGRKFTITGVFVQK